MESFLSSLSTNKMFVGLAMILMNVGSRYVVGDITPLQEKILASSLVKPLVVFCIFFVSTRDILVSCMLSFAYLFVVNNLLNEAKSINILSRDRFTASNHDYEAYVASVALLKRNLYKK